MERNDLTAHARTVEAIRQVQAEPDIELIAAAGRRGNSAREAFRRNQISLPSVLLNGAVGFDFDNEDLFHRITFPNESLRFVLDVLGAHGVAPVAYLLDTTAVAVEGVTTSLITCRRSRTIWCGRRCPSWPNATTCSD